MGRKKIPINRTNFRSKFFLLLAQQSLTQCEYKCLLILAEGESIITQMRHIDRGYEKIADLLRSVGAEAERID